MQKESNRFINSTVFEGMTSIRAIINGIECGINDRRIEKILFDKNKLNKIGRNVGYLKAVSEKYGFIVEESTADSLDELTLGNSHGGIIAQCGERSFPALSADNIKDHIKPEGFYAMIQGIEDPYNFGYSLRSLYACGCDGIILDKRNWMSAAGVVCRSSAGASEMFPCFVNEDDTVFDLFHSIGYKVVCAHEDTKHILGSTPLQKPLILIVGGEKRGISQYVIDNSDLLVKIPYGRQFNASLSAASATTMFAYEIMRQNSL